MNKKVLLVSMLAVGMLVGCGDNKKPTKEIDYKDAITKINEHKEEISTYDRIGVSSTTEKLKVEVKSVTGTNEEKISISTTNAKEEMKVAGLVSATKASEFSASVSSSVGSVVIDDGTTKIEGKDMAVKAYLDNSKLYVDLSNKGLKSFIEGINKEPIPAEDPDKFYLPLNMDDSDFPLITEDMFNKTETPDIGDLGDIGDLIGGEIGGMDPTEIIQMADTIMSAIDINEFVKVKSSKDYADFSFSVDINKENLVNAVEKGLNAMLTSMIPSDAPLTDEDKMMLNAQVAASVALIESSLEQGGFEYIKFNLEMRDYLVTEVSYDVKAGLVIPSMPTPPANDETSSFVPSTEEATSQTISVETKGNVKISYGDKVTVDTLKDYSEFMDAPLIGPGSPSPSDTLEPSSSSVSL